MSKSIVLVDTDPGVDDCAALMMLLSQSHEVKIVGLTCAAGNVGLRQVIINTVRIVKLFDKLDELLALGALTNVAMAAKLDPSFPKRLKSLHILGGTIRGYGNVSPCAEYNFFTDPEAAYNVFRSFPQFCPTDVVPFETTLSHGISPEKYDEVTSGSGLRKQFFRAVFNASRIHEDKNIARGINTGYCLCDSYLVATVLDPKIVKRAKYARVAVELGGYVARGSFIIDHKNKGSPHLSQADVRIIEEIDETIYVNLFSKAFEE